MAQSVRAQRRAAVAEELLGRDLNRLVRKRKLTRSVDVEAAGGIEPPYEALQVPFRGGQRFTQDDRSRSSGMRFGDVWARSSVVWHLGGMNRAQIRSRDRPRPCEGTSRSVVPERPLTGRRRTFGRQWKKATTAPRPRCLYGP